MTKLRPTIAVARYDRTVPLIDGRVAVDGCDPIWLADMPIETMFSRALEQAEFDVGELSFSNFLRQTAAGTCAYVGVPVFPSRSFRHGAWFVRADGPIRDPRELRGRRVGVREYSMTAAVVARGIVSDAFGLDARDMVWVVGDVEERERDTIRLPDLPGGFDIEAAAPGTFLIDMLLDGGIDALIAYKPPKAFAKGGPIRRLFDDHAAQERAYARRTGIFPIMHLVGIRRALAEAEPWLARSLYDAFTAAKDVALADLAAVQALKISLPWVGAALEETQQALGRDFWPYGVKRNRPALDALARWHHAQGLSGAPLTPEEMFWPTVLET